MNTQSALESVVTGTNLHDAHGMPVGSMTSAEHAAFVVAANPATILALIQRVVEAEAELLQAKKDEGEMILISNLVGRKSGRYEALEEAVAAMQTAPHEYDGHAEGHVENVTRARCIQAIRALLGEKAGPHE